VNNWKSTADYWDARYSNETAGWERGGTHPALTQWIAAGELKPCSIAVPGCGRGHESVSLAEAGFSVTAIDFADAALAETRERLRGYAASATFVQADVLNYRPTTPFDAVYEQTCLCAIEPAAREQYQQSLYDWLRPGGKLFALFMQTKNQSGEPPFNCAAQEMKQLFPADRWEWQTKPLEQFEHPSGAGHELAVVLKRKEPSHTRWT